MKKIMITNEKETWKPLPFDDCNYAVSNLGRFRNTRSGQLLSPYPNGKYNYQVVQFRCTINGESVRKQMTLHRLVWLTFRGEIPSNMEIDHLDNDQTNNALSNLALVTHRENCQHVKRKTVAQQGAESRKTTRPVSESTREKHRATMQRYWAEKKGGQR